jgi:hypothetical protein
MDGRWEKSDEGRAGNVYLKRTPLRITQQTQKAQALYLGGIGGVGMDGREQEVSQATGGVLLVVGQNHDAGRSNSCSLRNETKPTPQQACAKKVDYRPFSPLLTLSLPFTRLCTLLQDIALMVALGIEHSTSRTIDFDEEAFTVVLSFWFGL